MTKFNPNEKTLETYLFFCSHCNVEFKTIFRLKNKKPDISNIKNLVCPFCETHNWSSLDDNIKALIAQMVRAPDS
jgi:hypothetical protein